MARGVSGITCYRQLDCLVCPAEMNSHVFDTVAEDVLRELLTAPSQEDTQSDWEAAAAEAMEMVAPLPAAAGPEPAQNNASVELPGPTQMWVQPPFPEEDVLRELLPAPSQEDAESDWEAAAAEAMDMAGPLQAAAGPEPAQNNASVELPGPTQTPRKRGRSPSRRTGSVRRRIRHKQPNPRSIEEKHTAAILEAMLTEAIAAEQDEEPGVLPTTVKRKHMHWSFVRTFKKG